MQVKGAVALVTGANGDIGQRYLKILKTLGVAKIYAGARKIDSLAEIVSVDSELIVPVSIDITDAASVAAAAEQCQDVNLLINNAGIGLLKGFIAADDISGARAEVEVNYLGTLLMCRAFSPILRQNGGGSIVNMLSILGKMNFPMNASYSASKAAEISMTEGVRAELAEQGTLVVGVMPGTVDTEGSKHFPPPKVDPDVVVKAALQAVIDEVEDVYPGEQAKGMIEQLKTDPKSLEKEMAKMLPETSD